MKDEGEVFHEAGQDVVLYLAHMKYVMILFWVLFAVSGNSLFLIYWSISNDSIQTRSLKNVTERMSILAYIGVEDQYPLLVLLIFIVFVINVTAGHMQIYFFDQKCKEVKLSHDKRKLKLDLNQVTQLLQKSGSEVNTAVKN